jgi:hypothetical protein
MAWIAGLGGGGGGWRAISESLPDLMTGIQNTFFSQKNGLKVRKNSNSGVTAPVCHVIQTCGTEARTKLKQDTGLTYCWEFEREYGRLGTLTIVCTKITRQASLLASEQFVCFSLQWFMFPPFKLACARNIVSGTESTQIKALRYVFHDHITLSFSRDTS